MRKIAVLGAGFAGLSAATSLAKHGYEVTVFEKNPTAGGRARRFSKEGFTFDMGPSFYWMPDVFEKYFGQFGKAPADYYQLERLDPSYRVYFGARDFVDVPAGPEGVATLFEQLEPGSAKALREFLDEGKVKYDIGINKLVYNPGLSLAEFADLELIRNVFRLHVFSPVSRYVRKFFRNPRIVQLLEFPVLFLGAAPQETPALYTLMNYADIALGTWYPKGGIFSVVTGMETLARELGVSFRFNAEVSALSVNESRIDAIIVNDERLAFDCVVATADYRHVEQQLLPARYRRYTESYWQNRVMAPSALLFYIGLNKRVKDLAHHTLFFDEDFGAHSDAIYKEPGWPGAPQFYVSCTSISDATTAPPGCENLVVLIPVAAGLNDEEHIRERYFDMVVNRLEKVTGQPIRDHVVFKRSYAHRDFIDDYHAWKGNAYGLANTLKQTANFRPSIVNRKVKNLFYAGQLTVPGPGVPPSLISGQVVANLIHETCRKKASI